MMKSLSNGKLYRYFYHESKLPYPKRRVIHRAIIRDKINKTIYLNYQTQIKNKDNTII